jgi:hypothetical protein
LTFHKRLLLAIAIVLAWFTILSVISARAYGAPHRAKFTDSVTGRLRESRARLKALRLDHEAEPGYLLASDAYTHAINDLEDFQAHDPAITEERLRNDLLEVEMDISEFGEGIAWMKTSN